MKQLAKTVAAAVLFAATALPAWSLDDAPVTAQACWHKAFSAGDADAVTRCYTSEAVVWIPGTPMLQGRAAIHRAFADYFAAYTIKSVTLTPMATRVVGDETVSWGTFSIVVVSKQDGTESTQTGRFTDLSRLVDGRWQYVMDHASDDPPPANG